VRLAFKHDIDLLVGLSSFSSLSEVSDFAIVQVLFRGLAGEDDLAHCDFFVFIGGGGVCAGGEGASAGWA